mgnify:CR=1 FL=1
MGLRQNASADLKSILENDQTGFAHDIVLIPPVGDEIALKGTTTNISSIIDPDTGQLVSGNYVEMSLVMASVYASTPDLPKAEPSANKKSWKAKFSNISGVENTYRIIETLPDKELGVLVCILESFNEARP